ncbi:hypothetical protein B0H16DRAFT_1479763 [Mycena metata]|uniref:Uncharacterized protein n=1 Tax=Mycena metata TaxID=1033252 RepID=A0AAD7H4W4_9AGAR|nr:hypothetical protein B0H16DRAFT_1479763 [Mycena metata]
MSLATEDPPTQCERIAESLLQAVETNGQIKLSETAALVKALALVVWNTLPVMDVIGKDVRLQKASVFTVELAREVESKRVTDVAGLGDPCPPAPFPSRVQTKSRNLPVGTQTTKKIETAFEKLGFNADAGKASNSQETLIDAIFEVFKDFFSEYQNIYVGRLMTLRNIVEAAISTLKLDPLSFATSVASQVLDDITDHKCLTSELEIEEHHIVLLLDALRLFDLEENNLAKSLISVVGLYRTEIAALMESLALDTVNDVRDQFCSMKREFEETWRVKKLLKSFSQAPAAVSLSTFKRLRNRVLSVAQKKGAVPAPGS